MAVVEPIPVVRYRSLVIGSGVAGLSAAYTFGKFTGNQNPESCALVTADSFGGGGSTEWAQGGVAAVVDPTDSVHSHSADTSAVSAGLADSEVAQQIISQGSSMVQQLLDLGADFDRDAEGQLSLGREAGHSVRRVVKANGDAIGRQLVKTLTRAVRKQASVAVHEHTEVLELITNAENRVIGAVVKRPDSSLCILLADAVIVATGGYSYCFARTTNPKGSIGYGVALAAKVGATLADLEFVQFHPTALAIEGSGRLPLLTEALRGEGAVLVNKNGERFMVGYHPDAELAPRDVVARKNYEQLRSGLRPALDVHSALGSHFAQEFPTVYSLAIQNGFDPDGEGLPVTPAAHYCMGGVATSSSGQTSVPGLWVIGEAASTGLHGANRLASNSLLEGFVMGEKAAREAASGKSQFSLNEENIFLSVGILQPKVSDIPEAELLIRQIMWEHVGVVRSLAGLQTAQAALSAIAVTSNSPIRLATMHFVASQVVTAALHRKESRGAHYLSDIPESDPSQAVRLLQTQQPVPTTSWKIKNTQATPKTLVNH